MLIQCAWTGRTRPAHTTKLEKSCVKSAMNSILMVHRRGGFFFKVDFSHGDI